MNEDIMVAYGIAKFLDITCKPALEELGLMAKDMVRQWRLKNIAQIINKAEGLLWFDGQELQLKANAKVGLSIVEYGSMEENEILQELWAGLFASSCTEDGTEDSNLTYVDILRRLTIHQARLILYLCKEPSLVKFNNGIVRACRRKFYVNELLRAGEYDNKHTLICDIDYLQSIGLVHKELKDRGDEFILFPTLLGLNFYVKCETPNKTVDDFWDKYYTEEEYDSDHTLLIDEETDIVANQLPPVGKEGQRVLLIN
jgi:hypothetical protein